MFSFSCSDPSVILISQDRWTFSKMTWQKKGSGRNFPALNWLCTKHIRKHQTDRMWGSINVFRVVLFELLRWGKTSSKWCWTMTSARWLPTQLVRMSASEPAEVVALYIVRWKEGFLIFQQICAVSLSSLCFRRMVQVLH